jgi:UDP-glucose 4-epimerase
MTRCVVFGGAGFLGRHVLARLASTGRELVCVDRDRSRVPRLPAKCTFMETSEETLFYRNLLRAADEIIDLAYASVPKTSFEDPVSDIFENLPRVVRLCRAAVESRVTKMVLISSGGAIYGRPQGLPISEEHPTNPISPYGITKLAVEKYAMMFHASDGLPVVCLRPGNAYGQGQQPFRGQGFVANAIASTLIGRPVEVFGESGSIRDYVHVDDIAEAITKALDAGRLGATYNVGTGVGTSNLTILDRLRRLAEADGYHMEVIHHPARAFDVSANVLDAGRLRKDTGWRPVVSLERGLASTWAWYVANSNAWKKA